MRPAFAAAVLVLTLALAPPPAEALEAEGLKTQIEAMLAEIRAGIAPAILEMGAVEVVPEGDGFRVTLPGLAVDDRLEGRRFEIGTFALTVTEPGPGLLGFDDVDVPERMRVTEKGQETGWFTLDLERYSGVYSLAIEDFLQLDFLANSFEIRVPEEAVLIGGGRTTAWIATVPEHDAGGPTGYQRQRQYGHIENLVVTSKDSTVEIDQMTVDGAVEGLDLRLYETLVAIVDDLEIAGAQGDTGRLAALREALTEAIGLAETMRAGLQVGGLRSFDESGKDAFALDSLRLSMDLDTPRGEAFGSASLALAGNGLTLDPATSPEVAPYVGLVPQDWNIPLKIEHLPLEALALSVADLIYNAAGNALLMPDEQLSNLGNAVLGALGTGGSYFIVRDLFLEAPLLRLDSKASLAFSPNVELGVVGNWAMTLTGLDQVLALAEGMTDPDAKRMLSAAVLGMMGVGQAVALPDGRVGYRFSFTFAPDGTVQMNGFSFGDFLNKAIPQ
jgi:hypothetical protein